MIRTPIDTKNHMRRLAAVLAAATVASVLSSVGSPAVACATSHIRILLGGFPPEVNANAGRFFYWGAEGTSVPFVVKRVSDDCSVPPVLATADFTQSHVTTEDADYVKQEGTTYELHDPAHDPGPSDQTISIPIVDDTLDTEEAVETAAVVLTGATNAVLAEPSTAPLYIVDNDGTTRMVLDPGESYSQSETWSQVKIPVFRAGDASGTTTVDFSVSPGATGDPAEPDDYVIGTPGPLTFSPGERVKLINFSIVNDEVGPEADETVDVSLTGGATIEGPSTMTVTIIDNDSDSTAPKSWFHHPRHGKTYPYGDYRLREMHVFFSDEGGSEVVAVEMALRRKKVNGSCAWWYKGGWVAGRCDTKRWIKMKLDYDLYLKRFSTPLRPSVGTSIKNYTAWCRATDGAGNVQTTFIHDRTGTRAKGDGNWSTFEVARP